MQVKIEGFIVACQWHFEDKPDYGFHTTKMDGASDSRHQYVTICPHTLEFDLPDNFDMSPGIIKNLRDEKTKIRAEAEAKITAIEERIQSMLSIENKA